MYFVHVFNSDLIDNFDFFVKFCYAGYVLCINLTIPAEDRNKGGARGAVARSASFLEAQIDVYICTVGVWNPD